MIYEITRMPSRFAERAVEHITVKRADAANRHLRRMVRDMVAAEALLDRKAGVDLQNEVNRYEYGPLGPGLFILDRWSIPGRSGEVTIFIRR